MATPIANQSLTVAPWLFVRKSRSAVDFYKSAFGAEELYRHEGEGDNGIVCRLAIGNSEFWVSEESPEHGNFSPETLQGSTVRLLLTTPDPEAGFEHACRSGARAVHPVAEGHGWRVGRVLDPFGYHWELGRQIA
jgi:PhnB protein